ncbi:transcription factor bHLH110-like [Bidens hawaiensis]|uniref:transcription factor bHLH110-like n=1 Tax=Bidens hawaiensis TaxID=980011 RepID=UPI00404ADDE9
MDSSCYGLSWYHNHILNNTRNDPNLTDVKQHTYHNIDLMPASQNIELSNISINGLSAHELAELQQLARIKKELSVTGSCLDQLPDIINYSPTSSTEDFMSKNDNQLIRYNNNNQDMLLKTISNGCQIKHEQLMNPVIPHELIFSSFPSLKFSNLNQPLSGFDINLPALDPFGYPTFSGSFNYQPSSFNAHNVGDLLKDNRLSYGVDQMHSKITPTLIVETTDAKRPASVDMDAKGSKANPTKKSKLELRPPCTQLKVRKEKLGDRILALQQMVAPFGKTDTASVLMEAIGYIMFLHNQVETLSVPYMNSTPRTSRMSTREGTRKDGTEDTKRELRSRGLCLVPISCLTYVAYGGGGVWATP